MDFFKQVEELWRIYFSADEAETYKALDMLDPDIVIIGTGDHEFYTGRETFSQALEESVKERADIRFRISDLWCEQRMISPDVCLAYGRISIRWKSPDSAASINMDSRFSILFRRNRDGEWKVAHIHQSLPNREQMEGEYYPKTLAEQVEKVQAIANQFERMSQKDPLTGLVNYPAFEKLWSSRDKQGCWLFMVDLDDFKKINDTYGHLTGNQILQSIAGVLKSAVRSRDVVCRMGGDEFVLLCGGLKNDGDASRLAQRLIQNIADGARTDSCIPRISVGGTAVRAEEGLDTALERADQALYLVKKGDKNGYLIV